jgi:hypothetical protein
MQTLSRLSGQGLFLLNDVIFDVTHFFAYQTFVQNAQTFEFNGYVNVIFFMSILTYIWDIPGKLNLKMRL